MVKKEMIFAVPGKFSIQELGALLSDRLDARIEHMEDICRIYLDTFDWRLYRSGMVLEVECGDGLCELLWRELNSGKVLLSRTARKPPRNAADFHSAGIQPMLKKILGRRSLIPHATVSGHSEKLYLLNDDEKTVMRVELRRDHLVTQQDNNQISLDAVIYLFPYRGYETEFMDRWRWMVRDADLSPLARDPLLSALDVLAITPGQYTSRPAFSLDNKQPALMALAKILKRFLQVIDSNIEGARKGEDPEYLHDLLVAVRRTSIFLSRFSTLFPARNLNVMQHGFEWIEQEATPIRDLDRYMSMFDDFESRVDEDHRQALWSLYRFLQDQKKQELRHMRVSLDSPRYYGLIKSWREFLHDCKDVDNLPKAASVPIGKLARERISEIFHEFTEKSQGLTPDTDAGEIYALHQISKHLGYHLDVFSSLFPDQEINRLLKAHDKLQFSLNQFRDMDLQYSRLREYTSRMKKAQAVRKISLEAVEQLIADREREKAKARQRAVKQIGRFTRKKMRKRFRSMLTAPATGYER